MVWTFEETNKITKMVQSTFFPSFLCLLLLPTIDSRSANLRTNEPPKTSTTPNIPLQGTGNTGPCSFMITCQMCSSSEGCGWCSDCGKCLEGSITSPSSTNCQAWDFEQCSGSATYADLALSSHQNEMKERDRLVEEYRNERDNYVRAVEEVAAMEQIVGKASQTETITKSVSEKDESGTFVLDTSKKTTQEECESSKTILTKQTKELEKLQQEKKDQEKIIATLETDRTTAMEGGKDDTSETDQTVGLICSLTLTQLLLNTY